MSGLVFFEVPHGANDVLRLALAAADLPTADLDRPGLLFFGLSDDAGPIGYVGLEGDGAHRLLRSLVILPSRRGAGHGAALVRKLESTLAGEGICLHLLTGGAASFFRRLGYADAERATAPADIAATEQFASLCPASASYLVKDIQ